MSQLQLAEVKTGEILAKIFIAIVKLCGWIYLCYIADHFITKFW
jgi:hypothetical protein